jgi:hypothetical protein
MQPPCDLEAALGRSVTCTEAECSLWDGGCVVGGLRSDLGPRPDLARLLLALRERLDAERPSSARAVLPPGLRD